MKYLEKFQAFLPKYEEVAGILNEPEAAYIVQIAISSLTERKTEIKTEEAEAFYLVQALLDKCWERIHTGHFAKDVPIEVRKIYALCCFFKILYMLEESLSLNQMEKCNAILDDAILIGCTDNLYEKCLQLQTRLSEFFKSHLDNTLDFNLPTIEILPRLQCQCDVPQIECPSVEAFRKDYFVPHRPVLLLNTISHWPALTKWHDLNYILRTAGNRTVPIEIGSNYATDEWSQQLVKIRDFLKRQFSQKHQHQIGDTDIEYLAQHELFDQVPILKDDIRVPDYCTLSESDEQYSTLPAVDIKAWLGPKGTISPMHYDPKHNILCQLFGTKKIILAADMDTPYLYPHESEFLTNTSKIDAECPDFERFPLAQHVRFLHVTLQEGDALYIPPKWWHYVRSEHPSFSVSFWWD